MYNSEIELKAILGIPEDERLISMQIYTRKGKDYYRIITYSEKSKSKKRYHVPRNLEEKVIKLWQEYTTMKKQKKEIEREVMKLLDKYKNPELIREVILTICVSSLKN